MIELILALLVGYVIGAIQMLCSCHKKIINGWISTSANVYRCEKIDIDNAPTKE